MRLLPPFTKSEYTPIIFDVFCYSNSFPQGLERIYCFSNNNFGNKKSELKLKTSHHGQVEFPRSESPITAA